MATEKTLHADVVVLGSGPGGYTAAFRAADLGKNTILVEQFSTLGGVCLNVGCIPSKAFLHAAKVISEAREMKDCGVLFGNPEIDRAKLRGWVESVVGQLTGGLRGLARQRKVQVVHGYGQFLNRNTIEVVRNDTVTNITFSDAIIAVGSQSTKLPFLIEHPLIVDSTGALELKQIPKRLLIIGGGIIGLELATVYHELGSAVTIVELLDHLIAEADTDLTKLLHKRVGKMYENIYLGSKVYSVEDQSNAIGVQIETPKGKITETFDMVLSAVGRSPNGNLIGAQNAGIEVDERGFIPTDHQQRTNVPRIYAIGDVAGQPMLAHKATHQGKVAAEVIADMKSGFDTSIIPSVAYTDPEVAWVGVTEQEAKQAGKVYEKAVFPWGASGRALSMARPDGQTKLLFDPETNRIIGGGIIGTNAGELIAEVAHAIEMGADATDIGLTIHPHPTLSETVGFTAEAYEGTITDLYLPKAPKKHSAN